MIGVVTNTSRVLACPGATITYNMSGDSGFYLHWSFNHNGVYTANNRLLVSAECRALLTGYSRGSL